MRIGVPKEIKNHEYRVSVVPEHIASLVEAGHEVLVQTNAGIGIGITDADYQAVGATILGSLEEVFQQADMIVKVKEPLARERKLLRAGQLLFTFLHLAPDPEQTNDLLQSGAICFAYETVTDNMGKLPLLRPSSEVAGRVAVQVGAHMLEKHNGGRGILLGGVSGVQPAKVVVLGGGVAGSNAVAMAVGMGAHVTVIDKNLATLAWLDSIYHGRLETLYASKVAIDSSVINADLVIGSILVPGAAADKLVSRKVLKQMHNGSCMVDISIDQGGCFETSRLTSHSEPTYVVDGVIHYCVPNIPGAVPYTSSYALSNATIPFVHKLAMSWRQAIQDDVHIKRGLNVYKGHIVHKAVADALSKEYVNIDSLLN